MSATRQLPVALRWLRHFGATRCNYEPSRCAAVFAIAEIVRVADERRARVRALERENAKLTRENAALCEKYADLHGAVHMGAEGRQ